MIRSLALLTVVILLLALCGCKPSAPPQTLPIETTVKDPTDYVVNGIMKYPDYTFHEEPMVLTMRLKAVNAFKDLLFLSFLEIPPIVKASSTFASTVW